MKLTNIFKFISYYCTDSVFVNHILLHISQTSVKLKFFEFASIGFVMESNVGKSKRESLRGAERRRVL